MAALNVDTDGFRRTGELVELAGVLLGSDFDDPTPTPACASDPASETIMRNLNARHQWLLGHVRAGSDQATNAAAGMNDTAASYEIGDSQGAASFGQFGGSSSVGAPAATMSSFTRPAAAPSAMPTFDPIPDVSGTEGESLAQQLEAGAGPGPAVSAATRLNTLASRAAAANASLVNAQAELLATGESAATPGMAAKLTRGIAFTEAVAEHATALAAGYESAGNLHTLTYGQVGPSASWASLKTQLAEAQGLRAAFGESYQPLVDAYQQTLDDKEALKGVAATGLQAGGEVVSTPLGDIPDPGMDPNSQEPGESDKKKGEGERTGEAEDPASGGMQDMLQPLMGALGPLTQSLGKANPLQSVGQMAQQLGEQVSKLGGDAAKTAAGSSPLKPAAMAKPLAGAGKGSGGGGGGGSPIKPSSNLPGATHPASLTGSPSATPSSAAAPVKPAVAAAAGSGAMGGGMMPMGGRPGGDNKTSKINSYEDPLAEVEGSGRPGVVGEIPKAAAPVVNPDAQNAVKERLARRKKDVAGDGDG
ncbi:Fis family transcriptional regulator (plasmid) [Mycobacterium adipatum]|uniref:Fis family transcriptional regulator n=1 Tax=Mycobacterium adipatum TaxID=1682113 RepID=A0A172UWK6_9MYCO|nr:Fis family transcriptional regulator [Mycobacterium adipatum]ANE83423.1 Fis family transcriptional regulator [Mycobacterium adipatum]